MEGKKKADCRELADLTAAYGWMMGRPPTFAEWYGLSLHLGRVEMRKAVAVCRGMGLTRGEVGKAYFDAIAADEAEAAYLEYSTNSQRMIAEFRRGKHV